MERRTVVAGIGAYLPTQVVTNDDLSRTLDTTDAWIQERTGTLFTVRDGLVTRYEWFRSPEEARGCRPRGRRSCGRSE